MQRFTVYRPAVPDTHDDNQKNPPNEPQFEGVVFSDGRVAIRWLTAARSVSFWDSLEDMCKVHGHPEYGTYFVFHDMEGWQPIETAPKDGRTIEVTWLSPTDGEYDPVSTVHFGIPKGWTNGTWIGGTKEKPEDWIYSHPNRWRPTTSLSTSACKRCDNRACGNAACPRLPNITNVQ